MILRALRLGNLNKSTGLMLIAIGLFFGAFALVLTRIGILHTNLGANQVDFVRGLCFGFAIALEISGIGAIVVARRRSEL